MIEIVVATSNPHKVEEIQGTFALEGLHGVRLLTLAQAVAHTPGLILHEPEEIGTTFTENATIKALSYAEQTGRLCLADDSGLEVDALGGRPGVISSHYCTDGKEAGMSRAERDEKNNARVMRELEGIEDARRGARFVCVMVMAGLSCSAGCGASSPTPTDNPTSPSTGYRGEFRKHYGKLPHWQVAGATYFVTFRVLRGTMNEEERRITLDAIRFWDRKKMMLHSAVVMPDHAHLLFRPTIQPDGTWPTIESLLHSIKSFSANEINKRRRSTGQFWLTEYFDRIIRNHREMEEVLHYIENNAVKSGLALQPGDYPFLYRQPVDRVGLEAPHDPQVAIHRTRGSLEGRIGQPLRVPRGTNGFGYDPLFLVAAHNHAVTSAELTPDEKNRLSHRGIAAREMAKLLRTSGA